jgi:L-ascorbate metabolism protein UlaG (beta-lactamase superfamily)
MTFFPRSALPRAALLRLALLALALGGLAPGAAAEGCPGAIASRAPRVLPASLARAEVGVTFLGHATFLIETPGGVRIATDYNDLVRPPATPDVATMNKAHSTHYSLRPDPGIRHVLKGWNPEGGPARHDLAVGDVLVRNVPTNIRDFGGGTEPDGNSVFVFETADLCIAHLGHLHHPLTPEHLKALGRIDVLLVPVDGSYTLDTPGMIEVLRTVNAPLMIPMHFFGPSTLNRFLAAARENFPVEFGASAAIRVSREGLPKAPTVLVLPGR